MFYKCWTGRKWINIGKGWFAIGFGPSKFIERIYWRKKLVYWKLHHTKENHATNT